jgi:hypothetical protein
MSGTVMAIAAVSPVGRLGDHEPVAVEDELHLLRVDVEVALGVGHEAPVLAPGEL